MIVMREIKRLFKYFTYIVIERAFLLVTGNWKSFYGWYLNRQDISKTARDLKELGKVKSREGHDRGLYDTSMGDYQLKFLISCGLKPQSKLFELGFGFGRATIPLARYLEKGNYVGSEISKERFRIANEWVEIESLKSKKPLLVVSLDNRFDFLDNQSIDFVWAQSVFTHLPETELIDILKNLRVKLSNHGSIIFNFTVATDSQPVRKSIKDFRYKTEKINTIAHGLGYLVKDLDHWQSGLARETSNELNQMVQLITKRS